MDWPDAPIGMMRRDELLNVLLAVWKTQYSITRRIDASEFAQGYQAGFEEGLDALAQAAGLTDEFEAGQAAHRAKVQVKPAIEISRNSLLLPDSPDVR